jgi:hypothetical protein
MTSEMTLTLFAGWVASWTAEERALHSAGLAKLMAPTAIATHLGLIKRERDELGALLSSLIPSESAEIRVVVTDSADVHFCARTGLMNV